MSGDVVAVLLIHFVGQPPALGIFAQTQQVLTQLELGGQIVRIESDRLTLMLGTFRETIFLRELSSDQVVNFRIGRPRL